MALLSSGLVWERCCMPEEKLLVGAGAGLEHGAEEEGEVVVRFGDPGRRLEEEGEVLVRFAGAWGSETLVSSNIVGFQEDNFAPPSSSRRRRPEPLESLDAVEQAPSNMASAAQSSGLANMREWTSSLPGATAPITTPGSLEEARLLRAELGKSLMEETSDSIMGYTTPKEPQMPMPRPTLLGRHNIGRDADSKAQTLSQVKERATNARKQQTLRAFLVSGGFVDVNTCRITASCGVFRKGFTYPLHTAVLANDSEAVEVLLWAGADRSLADSKKLTALDLARKLHKRDSHRAVIALLETQ